MKRILSLITIVGLFVASSAQGGVGWFHFLWANVTPWWLDSTLTFWAPLNDPAAPLKLIRGTGTLSFTRATTATYVHPTTGLITTAADNVLRIESNGALIEGQRTNVLTYSRTLNNAAWVLTNATADNTITGEDGVSNSASWLAASDSNGTACQSVTIASAAYSGAFSLKRITGTGTVKISLDNGATYGSDVASSLSTSAWYRASKANQTLANPEICIQLGTSGDNVAVDYAQIEAGAFISSRIGTTTAAVTRNADVLTFLSSGNIGGAAGTVFLSGGAVLDSGTMDVSFIGVPGTYIGLLQAQGAAIGSPLKFYDGTNNSIGSGFTLASGVVSGMAISYSGSSAKISKDGALSPPLTFDGDWNLVTDMLLGYDGSYNTYINGHIKDLRIWNRAFTDAEMIAVMQ